MNVKTDTQLLLEDWVVKSAAEVNHEPRQKQPGEMVSVAVGPKTPHKKSGRTSPYYTKASPTPCLFCHTVFQSIPSNGVKYCSDKCRQAAISEQCTIRDPDYFWARVEIKGLNECWLWKAGKNSGKKKDQYGRLRWCGRREVANRVAFELSRGYPPKNLVLHTCDNPPCCNPTHLYDGTSSDNVHDCMNRNRHIPPPVRRGEQVAWALLNDQTVRKIRSEYDPNTPGSLGKLENKYGIDRDVLSKAIRRKTWKHIK